jgi:hypothetical protein
MRTRFPPPTSLKQLEDVHQEEWYKIPPETVQNLYESIPRRTAAVLKAKSGPTVSVVFQLFYPRLENTRMVMNPAVPEPRMTLLADC